MRQEAVERCQECLWLFLKGRVSGPGNHNEPSIGDAIAIGLAEPRRHKSVMLTPDQQCRYIDPAQPFRKRGIDEIRIGETYDRAAVADQNARIS